MKVDESNFEILQKVGEITDIDYAINWRDAENIDGYIETDTMLSMIEDLISKVEHLKYDLDELKEDVEENYIPKEINYWDEYGLDPNDFH